MRCCRCAVGTATAQADHALDDEVEIVPMVSAGNGPASHDSNSACQVSGEVACAEEYCLTVLAAGASAGRGRDRAGRASGCSDILRCRLAWFEPAVSALKDQDRESALWNRCSQWDCRPGSCRHGDFTAGPMARSVCPGLQYRKFENQRLVSNDSSRLTVTQRFRQIYQDRSECGSRPSGVRRAQAGLRVESSCYRQPATPRRRRQRNAGNGFQTALISSSSFRAGA